MHSQVTLHVKTCQFVDVMIRIVQARNDLLTSFDLMTPICRVDLEFATYYQVQTQKTSEIGSTELEHDTDVKSPSVSQLGNSKVSHSSSTPMFTL